MATTKKIQKYEKIDHYNHPALYPLYCTDPSLSDDLLTYDTYVHLLYILPSIQVSIPIEDAEIWILWCSMRIYLHSNCA